jgi:hypothetical protein
MMRIAWAIETASALARLEQHQVVGRIRSPIRDTVLGDMDVDAPAHTI